MHVIPSPLPCPRFRSPAELRNGDRRTDHASGAPPQKLPRETPASASAGNVRLRCGRGVLAVAVTLGLTTAAAAEPSARSGIYGNLTVVVASEVVHGAFFDRRGGLAPGEPPQFSCIFLLRGALRGGVASVLTWAPGDARSVPGELRFSPDGASLRLAEEPGGCGMTGDDMVGQPYEMTREAEGAGWLDVGMIAVERSAFHLEPGILPSRASFVVASDPVVILERRPGWVRARYQGGTRPVTGWLRAGDLAPPDPPATSIRGAPPR